ncbi:MAG: hypothetical protein VCB26_14300, partial [Candidatus Hydrogenedentota bacterium]
MKTSIRLLIAVTLLLPTTTFAQVTSENNERLKRVLERFPGADINGDGVLTQAELRTARAQRNAETQQTPRTQQTQGALVFDPGWEKDEFPAHAASLKTPDEIMAIYKSGPKARTNAANDAMSFPKPADGIMRIVGTGHSF